MSLHRASRDDLDTILLLLREVELPVEGVKEHVQDFLIMMMDDRVIGSAGLELYNENAVLRSVAVHPDFQGGGIGTTLTKATIDFAKQNRVKHIYLLTQTADSFFMKQGFERTDRGAVPKLIAESVEFSSVCPSSAICMVLHL